MLKRVRWIHVLANTSRGPLNWLMVLESHAYGFSTYVQSTDSRSAILFCVSSKSDLKTKFTSMPQRNIHSSIKYLYTLLKLSVCRSNKLTSVDSTFCVWHSPMFVVRRYLFRFFLIQYARSVCAHTPHRAHARTFDISFH